MAIKVISAFLVTLVATSQAGLPRPKPLSPQLGSPNLGLVVPSASGWGTPTTTTPPPETTGWPETEAPTTTEAPGWTTTTPPPPPTTTTTGWPSTTPGWPATTTGWPSGPVLPVDIEMVGETAVAGEGESGATHGSEVSVSGDASNPAILQINTGSYSSLGQGSGIMQISSISASGESNSFHGVDGYNFGDSGEYFGGNIQGNQINTVNGGGSFVTGDGAIGQSGYTHNSNDQQSGWRRRE